MAPGLPYKPAVQPPGEVDEHAARRAARSPTVRLVATVVRMHGIIARRQENP